MEPRRLPRPGEVSESCRLCGAELSLTLENPRRVCSACGEVNLPGDLEPVLASPVRAPQPAPPPRPWVPRELRAFVWLGFVPVVGALVYGNSKVLHRDSLWVLDALFRAALMWPLFSAVTLVFTTLYAVIVPGRWQRALPLWGLANLAAVLLVVLLLFLAWCALMLMSAIFR